MPALNAAVIAALSGFAVMSVELAAVRLFAPHFGDSAYVWTNVIGVLLVALAAGAWLGGRAAAAERVAPRLGRVLVVAGLITALVPWVAAPLGDWLLPADLPLDAAMPALVRASLVATLLVFAPPVLLAGMATPMLITALVGEGRRPVGQAAGLVATWSTVGSLVGTFATTHLLVPGIGSGATIWVCSGLWILAGLICGLRAKVAALLLLPIGFALLPSGAMRPAEAPVELLAESESAYQFLQVQRQPASDREPGLTMLKINEGLDSFHSVRIDGTPWTGGRYYDFHAAVPFLAGDGRRPDDLRVLSLGAAAGTFERIYRAAHPSCRIDSVELDPEVVRLGREQFGAFAEGEGEVFAGIDARVFVERSTERWQVILLDAYERQIYVPAHVASLEFFSAVSDRLSDGGVISVNVGGRNFDDPVVEAVGHTMAEVFGEAWAFRVPYSRNFVLVARRGRPLDPGVLSSVSSEDEVLTQVLAAMGRDVCWQRFGPGTPVLVDDRPFLDSLQERSLSRAIGDDRALSIGGESDVGEVEATVYELALAGDWAAVIATATQASEPTGYLRLQTGDARWSLHEQRGAQAEWQAAARLGVDPATQAALERRLRDAAEVVAGLDRATAVAQRNAWLAAFSALLVAGLAWFVDRGLRG